MPEKGTDEMIQLLHATMVDAVTDLGIKVSNGDVMTACTYMLVEAGLDVDDDPAELLSDIMTAVKNVITIVHPQAISNPGAGPMNKAVGNSSPPETRESKRALQIKSEVLGLLSDVVDVMERARAEGFDVAFSVSMNPETRAHFVSNDLVKVSKSW